MEKFYYTPPECKGFLKNIFSKMEGIKKNEQGVSRQNVKTVLKRFQTFGFLTSESTKQNRRITICNWATYQKSDCETNNQTNSQLTNDQQSANN
jgi:hypothetical protein